MKKFICMVLTLSMLISTVNIALPIKSYAENESSEIELYSTDNINNVTSVDEMQSEHPYFSNTDITYVYTHQSDADSLNITFSDDTEVESNYDFIYIYDGNDVEIGKYTGTELAGQPVEVSGNIVKIRLTSDSSVTRNGFTVTNIDAVLSTGPITNLRYTSRTKDSVTLSFPIPKEASSITVEQSNDGKEWVTSTTTEVLNASSTIATVTGLEMETQYYFRLNVVGGTREGLSNEVSVITYGNYTPEECFEFSSGIITGYKGEFAEISIPPEIDGVCVTDIGDYAFSWCENITSITIPNSVTNIGYGAFCDCYNLESIVIGDSVANINSGAFDSCYNLSCISVDESNDCYSSLDGNLFNKDKTTLIQYSIGKTESSYSIPGGVIIIEDYAFNRCENLTSIAIPNSVTTIGYGSFSDCISLLTVNMGNGITIINDKAFYNCVALSNITIPDSITSIGEYAFEYCEALTSITIPGSLTTISNSMFSNCTNLAQVNISDGVEAIGNHAFFNCKNLASITIPQSTTSISERAFRDCYALININVDSNNESYISLDGNVFTKDQTQLVQYAIGKTDTSYSIPNGVTAIGDYAFESSLNIKTIAIPGSVVNIGNNAFSQCDGLMDVTIPDSVTNIGTYVFYHCDQLTYISIGSGVPKISDNMFEKCISLHAITIPDSVTDIGRYAFYDCSSLSDAIIPDSVTSIGDYAFKYCESLTNIEIPNSVKSIGTGVFSDCDMLQNITIGSGITTISEDAFDYCDRLTSVNIPIGVISIEEGAFYRCSNLTNVTIPLSVTTIGYGAFNYCESLTDVYYGGCELDWNNVDIASNNEYLTNATLHFLEDNPTTYTITYDANGGSYPPNNQVKIDGQKIILSENEPFREDYKFLGWATTSDAVEIEYLPGQEFDIDNDTTLYAVWEFFASGHCGTDLKWTLDSNGVLTISGTGSMSQYQSVSSIPWNDYRSNITAIVVEQGVTNICQYSFCYCENLLSVSIADSVTSIGDYAFCGCKSLINLTLPDSITTIGFASFSDCSKLVNINIPNGITSLGQFAFSNCSELVSITIPNGITNIGKATFQNCKNLAIITIPGSVTYIGPHAFLSCIGLNDIFFGGTKEQWEQINVDTNNAWMYNATVHYSKETEDIVETYTITYDANGGSGAPEVQAKNEGESIVLSSVVPTREGYTFLGWATTSDATEVEYNSGTTFAVDADTTLYAVWEFAASGHCGTDLKWTLDSNGVLTISGTGSMSQYQSVSSIPWNDYRSNITAIVVEQGVTNICQYSFCYCENLLSVSLADSVLEIGYNAFHSCINLVEIRMSSNINYIGSYAFANCTTLNSVYYNGNNMDWESIDINYGNSCLTDATIHYSEVIETYTITYDANGGSGAPEAQTKYQGKSIILSSAVPTRKGNTFLGWATTADATEVEYNSGATFEVDADTTLYAVWEFAASGECGDNLIWTLDYEGTLVISGIGDMSNSPWYSLEESVNKVIIEKGVTSIGVYAFWEFTRLTSVTIPDSVTSIGDRAFSRCDNLTSITIPDSVTSIGNDAFGSCSSLTSVTIGDGVTSIGDNAFLFCYNLTSVNITDICAWCNIDFVSLDSNPLYYADNLYLSNELVTELLIPNNVTSIGNCAFGGCRSLTSVTMPDSVTSIGVCAFLECTRLTSVTIPDSVTSIGVEAFRSCTSLTSVIIPDSITSIGNSAFRNCKSLTSVTIPDSVTSIGVEAFSYCNNLTSVTIPDSVISIGNKAFFYCGNLTDVYYTGSEMDWNKISIGSANTLPTDAMIHYNYEPEPGEEDVEPLPKEGEIKKTIGIFKSYYEDDNTVWIEDLGDFGLVEIRYITDKTNTDFLDDLDNIIDEYVFVEENVYWEHGTYYSDILSVKPINTIIGKLSSVTNNTIVVDGKAYNIDKEFSQTAKLSLNKYVMIHILDDKIVGITQLYNKKGILTEYKESEGILVIDGGEYSISSAADMSSLSNINNMIGKKIGFYLDDEWGWNIVRISSHETVTGELWFYSKTQNEVSVGDKTYCINTDEYTFDEELLGKRVFCLVEDDFIIHMDSIYKLMPRLLISISSPELSYNNGFENSSFSVNTVLRNGWNYDLPQMYNVDVILEDEFFKTLSTMNITLGDMTWDANENVEYTLIGDNCGGVTIPFNGSHQITLEGKIKDGYVPPEYKTNLTSEFCVKAQEPKMSRTLTDTHNLRITNLGKKPLVAEPVVLNNTPLQNVYFYANQLNENLNDYLEEIKNTPDKVMSSEEQLETIAQRLMEEDDNSSSKRINGLDGIIGMPEEDRIYAYMAFAQYLQNYVNEGIDLGKIDVSDDVISVAVNIVNAVRSNMDWTQFSCGYGGYNIDINIGSYYNNKNGTITLQKKGGTPYTGYILSTNAEIASAMESYLNQVKELGLNATNEILYSYAGELAKLTGFADIEKAAIRKVVDRELNKLFKDSGYGDVRKILGSCWDCLDKIRGVLKCTTPDDLVGTLSGTEDLIKKLEKLDFEKYDISEGVTSKIVDKINNSRKALIAALNDYLIDEGTDSNGNLFDSFIKHIIECPVDFTVYDESNNEIGYVRNGLIYCDDSIHIETKGDVKYVYIPKDKDYKIELEATDDGEFTYVIEDVNNGNASGRLNFYQIPITTGNTFIPEIQTNALTGNKNEVYLNSDNGIIKADEYISGDSEKVLVEIGYVGNGTVVGGGAYTKGDSVTLSATANEGYSFKGWYNEDGIVSNKNIYRFPAISNIEIYAKFERVNIVDSRFTIDIDEDYTDKMYVKAYKNDGITNNICVNMFDFSNISAELDLKCVLYNNDEVIDEIVREAKFDKSCGGYVIDSVDLNQCDIMEIYDSSDNLLATLMNNDTCEIRVLDSLENSLIVNDDYVSVDLDVYNQSASQQTLRAYMGIYDNDNRLIYLLSSDAIVVESNTSNNLNIDKEVDIKNADSTYHIKLFIWENGNSLKPLSKTQEVIVNE